MNTLLYKLIALSLITITAVLSNNVSATETASQDVTNARQETQIWTTYALSPYLRNNNLKVSVQNGTATLNGKVDEEVNKQLAKEIALGVPGIDSVDNQIIVQADDTPATQSTNPTYGEIVNDASITAAIRSKLLWSKYIESMNTIVHTQMGKVTLSGTAGTTTAKQQAGKLAMDTRGVIEVDNQLVVQKQKSGDAAHHPNNGIMQQAGQNISDSWITTKIKSTFMYSNQVSSSDISVGTHDGIVTLSGKVHSGAERALAVELAKNVIGVKSVKSKGLTF